MLEVDSKDGCSHQLKQSLITYHGDFREFLAEEVVGFPKVRGIFVIDPSSIVELPTLGVGQNIVSAFQNLEPCCGCGISRVFIWMTANDARYKS